MKAIEKLSDIIHKIISGLAVLVLSTLTILSVTGVIFRFVLNDPIIWLYELSLLMFSWIIFLGTAMAFKTKEHMSLTFFMSSLKPKKQYFLGQFIYVISLIFMVIALILGFSIVVGTINQNYNTIPISKGIFYLSLPVCAIASIIHIISNMLQLKDDNVNKPQDSSL